jgi:hypothetical protein
MMKTTDFGQLNNLSQFRPKIREYPFGVPGSTSERGAK